MANGRFWLAGAAALILLVAGAALAVIEPSGAAAPLPPIYLTIYSHNEEPLGGRPDYTADRAYYLQNRALLKSLAETIRSRGAAFNFQSDWNYLRAAAMFEDATVTADTNGKNIVRWMREDLGVEVDPHAHETQYNYADVAYLIEQLGVTPSKNVGGFLYDPPDNAQGWEQHEAGIAGWMYPLYAWRADQITLGATYQHLGIDDHSAGMWRPQDRYNFYADDPARRLAYLGGCVGTEEFQRLLGDIAAGRAPADGFYTAHIGLTQDFLTADGIAQLGAFIDSLAPLVSSGRVKWSTMTETADAWRTSYAAQPFRWDCRATAASVTATPTPTATSTPTPSPATTYTTETVDVWITAPNGNRVYTRLVQPARSAYPGQRFPAVIAIPGGTGAGAPLVDNPMYRGLAASGFVVAAFNPEGRGSGAPGNLRSEGSDDCNGPAHQADLKAVVEFIAGLSNVDASNVGVQTSSFGLAIGAGALGRYPALPVAYLVDVEGPHDNRVITFYDAGREVAVCGHLSTVTDPSAANAAFWADREAVRWIGSYPGRYLRMQAEADHAQNAGYFRHALEMVNAATSAAYGGGGSAAWTRMNGSDVGNAFNVTYPVGDPAGYPVWLSGSLAANHPTLHIDYIKEMAALVAPASVGGVAEPPDVAVLPSAPGGSPGRKMAYLVAGAVVVLLGALGGRRIVRQD